MSHHIKDQNTHTLPEFSLDIPIFARLYDFYQNLSRQIPAFPKTKRYTLGQKLDSLTLEIFELLFSIPTSINKILTLQQISNKLDLLKILLRLAKDSQSIKDQHYLELQLILQEIGKMLGGWIRSTRQTHLNTKNYHRATPRLSLPLSFQSLTFKPLTSLKLPTLAKLEPTLIEYLPVLKPHCGFV